MRDPRTFKRPAVYNKAQDDLNKEVLNALAELTQEVKTLKQTVKNLAKGK